jgi:hypothetical protein
MNLDEVDLAEVCERLRGDFAGNPPRGYVPGKTAMREAMLAIVDCSELEAEELVDTLESRGLVRYEGDPRAVVDDLEHVWVIGTP